jgi:FAD/FMN-containing dehydrogenase
MRRKNSGGCNGVALVYWNPADPNDANGLKEVEKEAQMVARAIAQDAIDGQVSSIPKEQNTGYGNYDVQAASEQLNYEKTRQFFGSNYERLQKLKRQYDPEVVFRKWFAIEPAAA